MQHDEEDFIALMMGMLGPLGDQQAYEQAAMEAIADYRTEQQAAQMGMTYE
ncbi:hypothetical protein [Pantoea sp. NGS-ED-1003]|uniref:hypothetical protein n=1 Tax=Pantoea sp. NGS-ED-1003 TaxID=1526743 RepID=UPI000B069CD2|nr:hypothetical protein [Pantoea sp. NGS-ED-1003]